MPCEEREKLRERLASAAKAHTDSLRNMKGLNRWEFDRAWDQAEALRLQKEFVQKALAEHERLHACRIESLAAPA